jgi:hypothetical protein
VKGNTMANGNLHVSSEFFKTLSLESRQLNHTLHLLGTFAHRASVRGQELGDRRMVIIHHQLELFVSTAKRHAEGIEKLMRSVAIVA